MTAGELGAVCDKCGRQVWPSASGAAWTDSRDDTRILGSAEVCPAYAPDVNRDMLHTVNGQRIPPRCGLCAGGHDVDVCPDRDLCGYCFRHTGDPTAKVCPHCMAEF